MEGEFNKLDCNNIETTFSMEVNNIETSDELEASLLYQDKMGTNYSKSKIGHKAVALTSVLLFASVATTKIRKETVNNVPSLDAEVFTVDNENHLFDYSFIIKNPKGYKIICNLIINSEEVINFYCGEENIYEGQYELLPSDGEGQFNIYYVKNHQQQTIEKYHFIIKGE